MPPTPSKRPPSNDDDPRRKAGPGLLRWVLVGTAVFLLANAFIGGAGDGPAIDYTTFRSHLDEGRLHRVTVEGPRIEGVLQRPDTLVQAQDTTVYTEFTTVLPSFGDEGLMDELEAQGVQVRAREAGDSPWIWLVWLGLPFVFIALMGYMARRQAGGPGGKLFQIGQSKARLYVEESDTRTTFDDVAGVEGAKAELEEIVAFLREPERFERLGGTIPKGILLVGSPGTGKTLLARAVAGEAGVPFFSITGSDFMEMFVGVGAKRVRDLFEKARAVAPAIIFIDELDSIGRTRGAGLGGGHDEREQTLNQLLSEMDGFEAGDTVVVMAATNRPDILDPALQRPGRFDRQVTVHRPATEDREAILRIHAKGKPLDPEVDLEVVAQGTPGLSGADLENLLNEAALLAAREDCSTIHERHLEAARDKVLMGLEREGLHLSDRERRLLAYHEGGHALVAAALQNTDPLHKVSIVPRGQALGITQQLPEKDRFIHDRDYILDRIAVIMGGRAAEEIAMDTATSGAEDDLRQVTKLARKMVLDWGMSDEVGHAAPGGQKEQVFLGEEISRSREYSEETARKVDAAVHELVDTAHRRAREVLETYRAVLDDVADILLEREEVGGDEVMKMLDAARA